MYSAEKIRELSPPALCTSPGVRLSGRVIDRLMHYTGTKPEEAHAILNAVGRAYADITCDGFYAGLPNLGYFRLADQTANNPSNKECYRLVFHRQSTVMLKARPRCKDRGPLALQVARDYLRYPASYYGKESFTEHELTKCTLEFYYEEQRKKREQEQEEA